jgi:hypothetical protein
VNNIPSGPKCTVNDTSAAFVSRQPQAVLKSAFTTIFKYIHWMSRKRCRLLQFEEL